MSETSETINKFFEEVKAAGTAEVNIILHDTPDPDACGSGAGFQLVCKHFGIEAKIYYRGEVSHPQNKTLINLLRMPLIKTQAAPEGINICVDCTPANSCVSEALLVIDHHKTTPKSKYHIIKPNIGACATIIWKLISDLKIENNSENADIYTALLVGIRTDTNDLISENMTKDDFTAYQQLLEIVDKENLQKIMNYPLPRYLYEKRLVLHQEGNSYENNGIFVGGIGNISAAQRDVIAILAHEYTRMESVNTAIIFAITDKKMLEVSIRSNNVSLDVNQLCKDLFGEFGGGNSFKGAAKIPLNFYSNVDDNLKEDLWKITCNHMFKLVLKENWKQPINKEEVN